MTRRVLDYTLFANSKTLFKFLRKDAGAFRNHHPVIVHVNYHPGACVGEEVERGACRPACLGALPAWLPVCLAPCPPESLYAWRPACLGAGLRAVRVAPAAQPAGANHTNQCPAIGRYT